ncbi:hypothetical protein LX36DRAFT_358754 [Colletotrichum falcatum]|nr:hypothetical protein LX36DRAFT_358754 [Colletotrichum falcatum]
MSSKPPRLLESLTILDKTMAALPERLGFNSSVSELDREPPRLSPLLFVIPYSNCNPFPLAPAGLLCCSVLFFLLARLFKKRVQTLVVAHQHALGASAPLLLKNVSRMKSNSKSLLPSAPKPLAGGRTTRHMPADSLNAANS